MKRQIMILLFMFVVSSITCLLAQPNESEKGDVNYDGTVNIMDAMRAVNCILEIDLLNKSEMWRADCNSSVCECGGDGTLNLQDISSPNNS